MFGASQPASAAAEHATRRSRRRLRGGCRSPATGGCGRCSSARARLAGRARPPGFTKIDPWFLEQFRELVELRRTAAMVGLRDMSADLLRTLKRAGFGDQELAHILQVNESAVREKRLELGLIAAYKRIDTCAAEFESFTYIMRHLRAGLRGGADGTKRSSSWGRDRTGSARASSSTTAAATPSSGSARTGSRPS
ncbi:MAG: hypothetical protein R2708_26350 [Vicinamibacterales bacterium]